MIGAQATTSSEFNFSQPGVRVPTLLALRWIAILGQLIALGVITQLFGFPLQMLPALLVIGISAALNIALRLFYPVNSFLSGRQAALQLAFDLVQLAMLLYLTGGLTNPFAVLMLVPVTISATLLSLRSTLLLFILAMLCTSVLGLWSLPLPWAAGEQPLIMPRIYRIGEWVAILVGMAFLTAYAWRVSAEARRRQQALVVTQAALARAQQMSAVGSLAAAAAHELGSPLGTMTLIAKELKAQLHNDPDFGDDIALLNEQLTRCRDILAGISKQTVTEEHFRTAALDAVLHEVARPYESSGKSIAFNLADGSSAIEVERSPELLHGLDNIIANAVRHAHAVVRINASQPRGALHLSIEDDGPGFPTELLPHLGEPYVAPYGIKPHGMGLGIFISTTLLERIGGKVSFRNPDIGGGAVDIQWRAGA
jgi:two-component system, sensor histidine kinase RegB